MAGRYSDYDWRGMAMLTQQLGQLFEPSKAKLMSQQQEHEMNMLMAKKSWDMQIKELTRLELEYKNLTETLETETQAVRDLGLGELAIAGMRDGANAEQTSEVYEKLDIKKLSDIQELSAKYEDMIRDKEGILDNMLLYNETAKVGKKWSDELTAKTTEERADIKGKDYKVLHDADESGTLSWAEQNNALKGYIRDYYAVPEGEQGMNINIGDETLQATPEAHAFVAGFRHVRGRKGVDAAEAAAQVSKLKTPDQYLNTMYQARKIIEGYEGRGMSKRQLSLRKGSPYGEFTSADVDIYTSSHDLFKEAYKAYIKKGEKIPEDLIGVAPVTELMFYNDPDAWVFDEPKEFTEEGLTPEVYGEIQSSTQKGSETLQKIAFNIVYNWEDIMKHGEELEKQNMLKGLEALKQAYDF